MSKFFIIWISMVFSMCDSHGTQSQRLRNGAKPLSPQDVALVVKPVGGGHAAGNRPDENDGIEDPTKWKKESEGTKKLRRDIEEAAPWFTARVRWLIISSIYYTLIITFFAKQLYLFATLALEYKALKNKGAQESRTFADFLQYRFSYWFAMTSGSRSMVLVIITVTVLFAGAFVYNFFTGRSIVISVWSSFVWLVAPDAGSGENTIAGALIGAIMSILGLVIFALLLTLLQESFQAYLENQSSGALVEVGHTLLIGLTDHTFPIIGELCEAHESEGGTTIVVLTDKPKEEVEDKIREAEIDFLGSRVVVREGEPWEQTDLEQVAADSARTVVIMADREQTKEQRDATGLQILVTLRSQGWPTRGKILCVCSLFRNFSLFERIGGEHTEVVLLDRFSAKLMVQCSAVRGITSAVSATLGFSGSELYIKRASSQITGLTFEQAAGYYPEAILCGYMKDAGNGKLEARFCPSKDYVIQPNENIVLIATNAASTESEATAVQFKELSYFYLPIEMDGHVVLKHMGDTRWRATNDTHKSDVAGIGYRKSPQLEDKMSDMVLYWGKELSQGERMEDNPNWVRFSKEEQLPSPRTGFTRRTSSPPPEGPKSLSPETVVIIGWNEEQMTYMLIELDSVVPHGTTVHVMSPSNPEERESFLENNHRRNNASLRNITEIVHVEGISGCRYTLDEFQILKQATRIFILADEGAESPAHADRCTIASLLQIRDIFFEMGRAVDIPVIPEITDPKAASQCEAIGSHDYMDSSSLPSKILAMIAFEPLIVNALVDFLSDNGLVTFKTAELREYVQDAGEDVADEISFWQACALVSKTSSDVIIAWSVPYDDTQFARNKAAEGNKGEFHRAMADWSVVNDASENQLSTLEWELNPQDKSKKRKWTRQDRVVVLAKRSQRGRLPSDEIPWAQ